MVKLPQHDRRTRRFERCNWHVRQSTTTQQSLCRMKEQEFLLGHVFAFAENLRLACVLLLHLQLEIEGLQETEIFRSHCTACQRGER